MKTKQDIQFHTRGGLPFIVPAGSEVEPARAAIRIHNEDVGYLTKPGIIAGKVKP